MIGGGEARPEADGGDIQLLATMINNSFTARIKRNVIINACLGRHMILKLSTISWDRFHACGPEKKLRHQVWSRAVPVDYFSTRLVDDYRVD
jgi:hypothetical protein